MTFKKKMMLLAGMALAVVAFAVPASASAAGYHWTDNHKVVAAGSNITAPFEGKLKFTVNAPIHSTFECEVTIKVNVTGPTAASITEFAPTTTKCTGTGFFINCQLLVDKSNVPWSITNTDVSGLPVLDIKKTVPAPGNITTFNEYHSCAAGALPATHVEFKEIVATPTLGANGTVTSIAVSATSTSGAITSGSFVPEGSATLGLVTVQ
jgi:hypothetical protein